MKYKLLTPMGELEVIYLKERPSSFSATEHISKRVIITPSDTDDFDALMLDSEGKMLIAPEECRLAASLYFSMRGIPDLSLSVNICREQIPLPERVEICGESFIYQLKCKLSFAKTEIISGGIRHTAYTSPGRYRTRILPLAPGAEMKSELVRGLTVAPSIPDAVRSLAYSEHPSGIKMITSERCPTLDGVLALLGFLSERGARGEVRIYVADRLIPLCAERLSGGIISVPLACRLL